MKINNEVRRVSKARFEALSYARDPFVKQISEDIEWFSNPNNAVLGTILLDNIDNDYVAMVLGRDEAGVFRFIDCKHSIDLLETARKVLISKMESLSKKGDAEFPQGVITRKKHLIFEALVDESKMPTDYKYLVESDLFSPARELIQEIAYSFEDPDGNYIEQFQSTGFNSRLWELYLFALFHELDFRINREFNAPDYVLEKSGVRVCIEAVTVNSSHNGFDEPEPKDNSEKDELLHNYIPIKYGSSLYSKLKKKYWKKKHVVGHPLLIAIHDFHQQDSMMWSRPGLETYLYGAKRTHQVNKSTDIKQNVVKIITHNWKGKRDIPSNFFEQPDSEHISAIIHSNQATIGKFLRMGYLAEFGRRDLDIRLIGQAFINNNDIPIDFDLGVSEEGYEEYWANSVTIYHNPNAKVPLNYQLFEDVAHVFFDGKEFSSIVPQFYPIYGQTKYRAAEI